MLHVKPDSDSFLFNMSLRIPNFLPCFPEILLDETIKISKQKPKEFFFCMWGRDLIYKTPFLLACLIYKKKEFNQCNVLFIVLQLAFCLIQGPHVF
jgi:hypothetical protein